MLCASHTRDTDGTTSYFVHQRHHCCHLLELRAYPPPQQGHAIKSSLANPAPPPPSLQGGSSGAPTVTPAICDPDVNHLFHCDLGEVIRFFTSKDPGQIRQMGNSSTTCFVIGPPLAKPSVLPSFPRQQSWALSLDRSESGGCNKPKKGCTEVAGGYFYYCNDTWCHIQGWS